MGGRANSDIEVIDSFMSLLQERHARLGGIWVVGKLLHGPSVPCGRWTNRARREMGGVANSYMGPSISFCPFWNKVERG